MVKKNNTTIPDPRFRGIRTLAALMDNRFRIPGTDIRFGFDAIIGLVPGIGDLLSFLVSAYLVRTAAQKGASGYVQARMMLNITLDTIIGSIPILGDLFDVVYKSNQRNIRLLDQHFHEGRHQGSARKVTLPVSIFLLGLLVLFGWLMYKLFVWIF